MPDLASFAEHVATDYGLPVLWLLLLAAGLGLPLPEDIPIMLGGSLTANHDASWGAIIRALLILYSGVMIGDSIVYHLGWKYGDAVLLRPRIAKIMTPRRVAKVRGYYARYGALTVCIARNLAGVRFPTFLMAGVSRMSFWKFFLWDSLAACLSVPVWFFIGYKVRGGLDEISKHKGDVLPWIFGVVGVALAVLGFHIWKGRREALAEARDAAARALTQPPPV